MRYCVQCDGHTCEHTRLYRYKTNPDLQVLSSTLVRVALMLSEGHTNEDMQAAMFISYRSACKYVHDLFTIIRTDSRVKAALWAYKHQAALIRAVRSEITK